MHKGEMLMDMLCASAASACVLGIIFSVLKNMTPSEKFSGQINMIFSLILILVIASSFADIQLDSDILDFSETVPDDYSEIYDRRTERLISANISEKLGNELASRGIDPIKISVDINNSADGSISITGAEIIIEDSSQIKAAEKAAAQALGIDISFVNVKSEDTDNEYS